ncbi:PREDICTED: uncharacterized protein K02A2.6-like [Eufriesea mexicana]|uniref:uncharacterized protein K02A2.6-like n=1 Tax=Eufriesea mexicana TaxID=516756 RepID=UPI00083C78E4|nr:PREDICTED: uncharacterized protein K02A2.6-like [Eufriesea mexicana]
MENFDSGRPQPSAVPQTVRCSFYRERHHYGWRSRSSTISHAFANDVLNVLHRNHPGIRGMKNLVRHNFYWPGLSTDVENLVDNCSRCRGSLIAPVKVPLSPWLDTGKPWVPVHMDFAEPRKGNAISVAVDSYSRLLDATWMILMTTRGLANYRRILIRDYGPPETFVTDNGMQFVSEEFAQLCSEFNIQYLRSPPHMPQCNGLAERVVQTVKKALDDSCDNLDSIVSTYKYTPHRELQDRALAEIFFARRLRTSLDIFKRSRWYVALVIRSARHEGSFRPSLWGQNQALRGRGGGND